MNIHSGATALLLSLTLGPAWGKSVPPPEPAPPAPRPATQLIVQFKNAELARAGFLPAPLLGALSEQVGAQLTHRRRMSGDAQVLRLDRALDPQDVQRLAQRLAMHPLVTYAVADRRVRAMRVPNDPQYEAQWHLHAVQPDGARTTRNFGVDAPAAWDITTGDAGVVVAVIDSGILPHADFDAARMLQGFDFISDADIARDGDGRDPDPFDQGDWEDEGDCDGEADSFVPSSWHGTHVAGTVGAWTDNGEGVAGMDWAARILPLRVLGHCGGFTSDIVDAVRWAAGLSVPGVPANANPARVLNLSLGGEGDCSQPEIDAINAVRAAGAVVVVAAGNADEDAAGTAPANCPGVITVAATDRFGLRATYSNFGSVVTIAAPGGELEGGWDPGVLSTADGGQTTPLLHDAYRAYQGTSMATPHVSGTIALMLAVEPALTPGQILDILTGTATGFPVYGGTLAQFNCDTSLCGAGIVNAGAAVAAVQAMEPDTEPDPFEFTNQSGVALSVVVTSDTVTITGISHPAPVSVANGQYSIGCTGTFVSEAGTISNGQSVCLRHTSASQPQATVTTTLTIGGVQGTFSSTTEPPDTTPNAFAFTAQTNVAPETTVTSNTVTITGINQPAEISVASGQYSIGCSGTFVSETGTISNGQSVCLRHTSAAQPQTTVTTTLTIGGVQGAFSSTTRAEAPPPSGGGGGGGFGLALWLALGLAAGLRRRSCTV